MKNWLHLQDRSRSENSEKFAFLFYSAAAEDVGTLLYLIKKAALNLNLCPSICNKTGETGIPQNMYTPRNKPGKLAKGRWKNELINLDKWKQYFHVVSSSFDKDKRKNQSTASAGKSGLN